MRDYKIEIKCWRSGRVLFSASCANNTMRLTVEAAVKAGADLTGAYLASANLTGANLTGANLTGANLTGADLAGAHLASANLEGADLAYAYLASANLGGANLTGANLAGANLYGANLYGAYLRGTDGEKITLVGSRPILQIGPIGSEWGTLIAYLTDRGIYLSLGCFFGTREQFEAKLADTHGDNVHSQEYRAALALIDAHERMWMPVDEASDAEHMHRAAAQR